MMQKLNLQSPILVSHGNISAQLLTKVYKIGNLSALVAIDSCCPSVDVLLTKSRQEKNAFRSVKVYNI